MADESIVIEIKDSIDSSIANKLRDIAATAKEAQKTINSVKKELGNLNVKAFDDIGKASTAVASAQNRAQASASAMALAQQRLATEAARTAAAQDKAALSTVRLAQAQERAAERQRRAADSAKRHAEATEMTAAAMGRAGMSAKAYSNAMRGVPAQITDIVVSLQGGQRPLTVLLQQGGQLKDMFGGIRPALSALASGLLALINPFTITAAVVGTLGVAFFKGQQELIDFRKEATITGNMMAVTAGQFAAVQEQLAAVGTKGKAAEALTEIAKAGNLAGGQIANIAKASILMEKATGTAIEDTVAQFKKLADEPAKASAELNKQYNYLTLAVYEQIKALEKQGRVTEAATIAEKAYADALVQRANEVISNAGLMERAWNGLASTAKGAWDAMLNVGRPTTSVDVEKQLKEVEGRLSGGNVANHEKAEFEIRRKALTAQLDAMQESERLNKRQATGAAERQRIQNEAIEASKVVEKITGETASKQDQLNKSLSEYRNNLEKIRKADPNSKSLDPSTIAKAEANIRDKFKSPAAHKSGEARALESRATAMRKINLQLDNEIRLLGMLGPEREKMEMFDRIDESLVGRKIKLSAEESAGLRAKIAAIVEGSAVASEYNRIYEESNATLTEYNTTLLATGDLLNQGKISQEEANKQILLANDRYKQAVQPLYAFNKQLEESAELRKFHGTALEDEIVLINLRNAAAAKGQPLSVTELEQLRETVRLERERNALHSAKESLIAGGPGARQGASTQIQALGQLKASGEGGFTQGDASSATTDVLKSMGIDVTSFQVALNTQAIAYEEYFAKLKLLRENNLISAQELSNAELQLQMQQFGSQLKTAEMFFGGLEALQKSKSKTAQRIGKAAAITNTVISTYQSATSAYAAMAGIPYVGPALGIAAAAAAVAAGMANVQAIRSQGTGSYAMGGYTGSGSSMQPAGIAHKEEYIFDAAATRRIGVGNLAALRSGAASVGTNSKSVSSGGKVSIVVENKGTPQVYEQAPGLTADEVRLIARDINRKETPQIVAAQMRNPNSETRKSMNAYTNVTRKESS